MLELTFKPDVPPVEEFTARVLFLHHIGLAIAYFEIIEDESSVKEAILHRLTLAFPDADQSAVQTFLQNLHDIYEEMK